MVLRAAVMLAAAEAVVLLAVVAARGGRGWGLTSIFLVVKVLCCRGALRLGAGAFLALLLYEGTTVVLSLAAGGWALVMAASAAVCLVLLVRSLRLFAEVALR
jgi:hypothetical protein